MEEYSIACSEVSVILNHLNKEDYNKIPKDIIEVIEENKDENYNFEIDNEKELREQKLSIKTRAILFNLFRDYLCSDNQREIIKRQQQEEREKYQVGKDNLFKNIEQNEEQCVEENTSLISVQKESFIQKLINKIKKIFKK